MRNGGAGQQFGPLALCGGASRDAPSPAGLCAKVAAAAVAALGWPAPCAPFTGWDAGAFSLRGCGVFPGWGRCSGGPFFCWLAPLLPAVHADSGPRGGGVRGGQHKARCATAPVLDFPAEAVDSGLPRRLYLKLVFCAKETVAGDSDASRGFQWDALRELAILAAKLFVMAASWHGGDGTARLSFWRRTARPILLWLNDATAVFETVLADWWREELGAVLDALGGAGSVSENTPGQVIDRARKMQDVGSASPVRDTHSSGVENTETAGAPTSTAAPELRRPRSVNPASALVATNTPYAAANPVDSAGAAKKAETVQESEVLNIANPSSGSTEEGEVGLWIQKMTEDPLPLFRLQQPPPPAWRADMAYYLTFFGRVAPPLRPRRARALSRSSWAVRKNAANRCLVDKDSAGLAVAESCARTVDCLARLPVEMRLYSFINASVTSVRFRFPVRCADWPLAAAADIMLCDLLKHSTAYVAEYSEAQTAEARGVYVARVEPLVAAMALDPDDRLALCLAWHAALFETIAKMKKAPKRKIELDSGSTQPALVPPPTAPTTLASKATATITPRALLPAAIRPPSAAASRAFPTVAAGRKRKWAPGPTGACGGFPPPPPRHKEAVPGRDQPPLAKTPLPR